MCSIPNAIEFIFNKVSKTKKARYTAGFPYISSTNYLVTYITSLTALITRSGFGRYSAIKVGA